MLSMMIEINELLVELQYVLTIGRCTEQGALSCYCNIHSKSMLRIKSREQIQARPG